MYVLNSVLVPLYLHREAGIGTSKSPGTTTQIDSHRMEIIKLLITCFSESLYIPSNGNYSFSFWRNNVSILLPYFVISLMSFLLFFLLLTILLSLSLLFSSLFILLFLCLSPSSFLFLSL